MELPPFEPEHLRELEIERLTLDAWACRFDNRGRCRDLSLEALLLADELKYRLGQGLALKNLGFCDYADANFEKALEKLEEALAIARECSSLPLERDCLNFIGATHHRLGDLESAIGAARAVLAINTGLRDEAAITDSLNNFGVLHAEAGDHGEAIRLFREALARERSPHQEALGLANLGRSLVATGAAGEGTEVLRRALRLADDHGLPDVVAPGLVNLAEALTGLGRFDEALEVLDQALEAVRESGSAEGLVHCLLGMARIHAARGHFEAALEAGSRALEAAATLRHRALELEAHGVVTAAHKGLGRYERALFHTERGHAIERELREAASASRLRAVGAQFEVRRARQEAEVERLRNVELAGALERLEAANAENADLVRRLEAHTRALESRVTVDELTGLFNRRHLDAALAGEFAKAKARDRALPVAVLNLDGFRAVNERHSHALGDRVLVEVARILASSLRSFDLAVRSMGDEFVVLLPRTTPEQARVVCERLRAAVAAHDWASLEPGLRLTLSAGLASDTGLEHGERLLAAAEANLREAKRAGGNRVEV